MDDLSRLLVQQPQPGARFGQGTLREWNPDTFEHVIEWRGLRITGATILAGVDALTWQPGDQVLLLGADQSGRRGWTDWMVLGRAITPGPGAGAQAIDWMRSSLVRLLMDDLVQQLLTSPAGQDLAAWVLAQRVKVDTAPGEVEITSGSYVSAPGGPSVSADVSDAGVAIVTVTCRSFASPTSTSLVESSLMSVQVSGASSRLPGDEDSLQLSIADIDGNVTAGVRMSAQIVYTGLNPGSHTFAARYRGEIGDQMLFDRRAISVIAL